MGFVWIPIHLIYREGAHRPCRNLDIVVGLSFVCLYLCAPFSTPDCVLGSLVALHAFEHNIVYVIPKSQLLDCGRFNK